MSARRSRTIPSQLPCFLDCCFLRKRTPLSMALRTFSTSSSSDLRRRRGRGQKCGHWHPAENDEGDASSLPQRARNQPEEGTGHDLPPRRRRRQTSTLQLFAHHRRGFCQASFNSLSFTQISHSPLAPAIRRRGSATVRTDLRQRQAREAAPRTRRRVRASLPQEPLGDSLKRLASSELSRTRQLPVSSPHRSRRRRPSPRSRPPVRPRSGRGTPGRARGDRRVNRREELRGQFQIDPRHIRRLLCP